MVIVTDDVYAATGSNFMKIAARKITANSDDPKMNPPLATGPKFREKHAQ
jgi:hypothetical protein